VPARAAPRWSRFGEGESEPYIPWQMSERPRSRARAADDARTPCAGASPREAGYLLALLDLSRDQDRPTQAALARSMQVSAPTALEMVRRLRQLGLVEQNGLALTHEGVSAALVLASHRRAAHMLAHDLLGMDDQGADAEAARLAPSISAGLTRRLMASRPQRP
jgi:DtxR family transcriptional regulator, Mn-dependent transcriptional regulator